MKDNISKISSEVLDMNPYKQSGNRDSYSSYNEGWADACDVLEQRLLEELTEPSRPSDNQKSTEELCECGHARQYHGKSHSINYTEGKCMKCKCEHFVIDNQSNLTKAKGIVRNWLHIKPKDEHKLIFAMKEIDELYHATQHHTPTSNPNARWTVKDINKAKKYLSNEGYGTGTNFTVNTVANLMAEYSAKHHTPTERDDTHPEDFCDDCGLPNVTWFAQNDLWNKLCNRSEIICPKCFQNRADKKGIVISFTAMIKDDLQYTEEEIISIVTELWDKYSIRGLRVRLSEFHSAIRHFLQFNYTKSKPTEKTESMGAKEIEDVINSFFPTDIKNESEEWNIAQVNKRFGARVMLQRYATSVKDAQVQDGEE